MIHCKSYRLISILAALVFFISASVFAGEEPEFVPGEDSGFFYTIKKGDTLWDLSQKFYHSQWDWPGLWEMNDDIKNPHWIYPGKKIRIFLKERPKLKPKVVEVTKYPPKPPEKVKPSFSFSKIDRLAFIKKEQHPALGSILKDRENKLMMADGDIIYIKPSGNGILKPGQDCLVFSADDVRETVGSRTFKGVKHRIKAKAKILEHHVNYITAKISKGYLPVNQGDLIMEYVKQDPVLTVEEDPAPIDARIICSEENHLMINDYAIAFINKGTSEVLPGQIYTVMRENQRGEKKLWSSGEKSGIELENFASGKLIVLHTEETASTVMILSSKYAIEKNDIVN